LLIANCFAAESRRVSEKRRSPSAEMQWKALLAALSASSFANAEYTEISKYAMENTIEGRPFYFLVNNYADPKWQYFETKCGLCDEVNPVWHEIIKCYQKDPKVVVGTCNEADRYSGSDYWNGVESAPNPWAAKYPVPVFLHGKPGEGNASDPRFYHEQGFMDRFTMFQKVEEVLGPCCGPAHLDLCDDKEQKEKYEKLMAKSVDELLALVEKMHEKDKVERAQKDAVHLELWNEVDLLDSERRLDVKDRDRVLTRWHDALNYYIKTSKSVDSAIGSIRRALHAKGHKVEVEEGHTKWRGSARWYAPRQRD